MHDYINHYEMKKNRLIVLENANRKCESCGNEAKEVHHRDISKSNHETENLMAVCKKCHVAIHAELRKLIKRPRLKIPQHIKVLDKEIERLVEKKASNLKGDAAKQKKRTYRYWITYDIRKHFKLKSWMQVEEKDFDRAVKVARKWF